MNLLLFLTQIQIEDTTSQALDQEGEITLHFWELAFKGGPVMIPIVLLSIVAVYIFFERFFVIRQAQKEDSLLGKSTCWI